MSHRHDIAVVNCHRRLSLRGTDGGRDAASVAPRNCMDGVLYATS